MKLNLQLRSSFLVNHFPRRAFTHGWGLISIRRTTPDKMEKIKNNHLDKTKLGMSRSCINSILKLQTFTWSIILVIRTNSWDISLHLYIPWISYPISPVWYVQYCQFQNHKPWANTVSDILNLVYGHNL